jgi:hypothetical protein
MKLAKNLTKREIEEYIKEYEQDWKTPNGVKDKETFADISQVLSKNGYVNRKQLYKIARWKSPRVSKIVKCNPDSIVESISAFALKIPDEKYKIRLLCALDGIDVPRASAILAMSNPQKYGVIDINAWFALTGKEKHPNAKDWIWYLEELGKLAKKHGKTPRQIDMALMKYGQKLMKRRGKKPRG